MPFLIISIIIQVLLIYHVLKHGKNTSWIYIIAMIPVAGTIAYLIIEVLPELNASPNVHRTKNKIKTITHANKKLKDAHTSLSIKNSHSTKVDMAQQLYKKGQYIEAKEMLVSSLEGIYKTDPNTLYHLAKTNFKLKLYVESKENLDSLIENNPDYTDSKAHLIYARTLDALDLNDEAMDEYRTVITNYIGPKARYYYACFLVTQNQPNEARNELNSIISYSNTAGKNYNTRYKPLIKKAKSTLKTLT
jgi:hypothetical protein